MSMTRKSRLGLWQCLAVCFVVVFFIAAHAQEPPSKQEAATSEPEFVEGPDAALEFEKSFRDSKNHHESKPIRFEECKNITMLTRDLWSKKHVLTDFKKNRTDEVGVIVFVKTEYCCDGSRLCAVATACFEKKSTPLVGRFRVYGGWIKNNPDHSNEEWSQWDRDVIKEYDFVQGPGARVVVMVPTWDGKMYQWNSTATKLGFGKSNFEKRNGKTPKLERFLKNAIKYAPIESPTSALSKS